ncbi:MAG: filamentous hemagglutinin N-terminal domain-containing protein, partial [Polynucleobacter sp.]
MNSSLNRIFRVIWSKVQMTWIAVSEIATAHGKQQSLTRITRSITAAALMTGGAVIAAPPVANQLPTGGVVSAGSAAITTSGNSMTVTQSSNRAAINWNGFDIGSAASVNFVQPSSQAIALNRVNSPNPSQIYGQLSSNGQVYLINPSGVFFAPGSQVNVGGIVATTHQMSDAAFMAGSTKFERNGSTGKVINEGTIQTSLNGYIAMLAPEVRNSGLLLAQSGTVALAAAETVTLNFGPTSKLDSITVTAANLNTLIENRHAIKAPNGLVILSARSAAQLGASVVNSGTIEAKGIAQQGGRILLEASTVSNTGTLDVSSDTAQAGTIQINGKNVSLSGSVIATSPVQGGTLKVQATQSLTVGANIDVSGALQGGQVQMSGSQVAVANSTINADGDIRGGNVALTATNDQQNNPVNDPDNL